MSSYVDIVEQKVQEKLREYQINPAKFYLDIFPNCTEEQKQLLNLFLQKQFNKFEVTRNGPYTYDTFAKLAFYSFLINPKNITLVLLPAHQIGLDKLIRKSLSNIIESFRQVPYLADWIIPHLKLGELDIGRLGRFNSGIMIKSIGPCTVMGYPPETNILIFGDIGLNPRTWEAIVNMSYDNKIVNFFEV
ncbi:hypothetical protein NNO96_17430 [Acinetobacter baumannii]|uniref:hypothetical protein n=1 Tax=Acinetobacter baumannii TaxID=470 RepID=UPI0020CDFA3B|nr:hypothetical protein [Acinetobacter baumannii]MCQ1073943.1 hypothetical protein [Acinetobacter baumannii]